ncbi:MAG: DUF502 domain-containing protein [Parachlamydiales bacterium]
MKKYFATGLVILLPVVLTITILIFLVNLLTGPFIGALESAISGSPWAQHLYQVPGAKTIIHYGAQILILVFFFFFTVFLGMLGRWFFFKWLLNLGDYLLHRIPLVNKVYKTTQDIIKTVFSAKDRSFKQVVMVPFPMAGTYCLGLVSGEAPPKCKASAKSDLISVFVATTPNPTSGFLMMYPREACIFVDVKVEEAVKFIISCGVIHHGTHTPPEPEAVAEQIKGEAVEP